MSNSFGFGGQGAVLVFTAGLGLVGADTGFTAGGAPRRVRIETAVSNSFGLGGQGARCWC